MIQTSTAEQQLGAAVHQNAALSRTGMLERLFSRLFQQLVYPQIWEDPAVDMQALNIQPSHNLVCIASGSCNVLSYLTQAPQSVLAVDLSPAHIALGKLKLTAAQSLADFDDFYRFFGQADSAQNVHTYDQQIAPNLDPESRAYWEQRGMTGRRIAQFQRGFYRHGLLGRFIGAVHLLAWAGRVDFRPLLAAQSIAEQTHFFDTKIAPLFEKRLVRALARRRASLFGLGIPPAQYDKLAQDGNGDVIPVLRERVRKLICDFPIQNNYFAWQAFHRAYQPTEPRSVPPYLARENFAAVKAGALRVRMLNRSLTDQLAKEPAGSKHGFVLLDAQDWMTDAQLNALWDEIHRTAAAGATVIFRTGAKANLLPGRVAPDLLAQWTFDQPASEAGFQADRSAIYGGFHVYRRKG
jgi:S-adenosylmethionine-diacylglycerol 3-amino-3-carboxypropyl transferase